MDYNQAYNTILTWITDNNNKEITAAIMRDVLKTLLDFADENIGDTGDLFQETNTVDAINELYSLVNGININAPLQVLYGAPNPNTTPPAVSFQAPDIYVREEDALRTVYMYNGVSWIEIMNFKLAVLKNGSFVGSASRMNFLGGNWDISFDPITGQANIEVTGAGVAKLEDVGDVPPYPNDGKVYKLNEENGVLTWEEDAGGGTIPDEESINGTAIYNGAMTGTVELDLATFTDLYGILTGNTIITVSNTPASGESFVRSATIKSTTTESLQLPVGWKLIGEYKADGSENDLEMKFTNYPTVGLKVLVYINEIP